MPNPEGKANLRAIMKRLISLLVRHSLKNFAAQSRRTTSMKDFASTKIEKLFLILALLLPLPAMAQSLYLYPTAPIAPRGSYQSVTAIVTGVNDKTVTWTTDGGTIVGTNPCIVNEPCTVALYTTTAGTYHLTATSNANSSVEATSTVTFTDSPTPASTHPRLVVTAGMLPALQAKGISTNPVYQNFYNMVSTNYYTPDSAIWTFSTWNGSACTGGSGPSTPQYGNLKEGDANFMAWISMVSNSSATRNTYGCAARDIWVYVMTNIINGNETINGNHWSDSSPAFILTTDWLMAGGYLSSSDIALARQYCAYMLQSMVLLPTTHLPLNGYTPPVGPYNNMSVIQAGVANGAQSDKTNMRGMGNNYNWSRLFYLVGLGTTFNDNTTDDPPLTNTCSATRYQVCTDGTAGSMHAYLYWAIGVHLFMDWARFEDPAITVAAYGAAYGAPTVAPTCIFGSGTYYPCFGDQQGGESAEGSWYQYSLYRLRYALNILYTAGYNDPMLYGPQVSLATSSWWDMKYVADESFLTSFNVNNFGAGYGIYNGFAYFTTGDSNEYVRQIQDFGAEAATMTFDTYTGRTDRTNALWWGVYNMNPGMGLGTAGGCSGSQCGFDANIANIYSAQPAYYDTMISLPATDPQTGTQPTDPRPGFPTDLYNGGQVQHLMVRNNWTQNANTVLSVYGNSGISNHEHTNAGRWDLLSNGEYITKGQTTFDDYNSQTSVTWSSNLDSIPNIWNSSVPGTDSQCNVPSCVDYEPVLYGGQFDNGEEAGFATVYHAELPDYAAYILNDPGDYNGWWSYNNGAYDVPGYDDVSAASRDIVYLRGQAQVVTYDRAATIHASTKSTFLTTTGSPTISANVGDWLTRSGTQRAYLTNLLPSGATISDTALICDPVSGPFTAPCSTFQAPDWEPYTTLQVAAPGTPTSAQFLSVVEWGSSGFTQTTPALVQSTSGMAFDGAVLGNTCVMFMQSWPATLSGTAYPASGCTTQYVSDLTPNATYPIVGDGTPPTATADTAGVLVFSSAGTGNISIGTVVASQLTGITVTPASISLNVGSAQQYTATCSYSNSTSANCTSTVTWTSSVPGFVTINGAGLATGVAAGSANIIATSASMQGPATVTINLTQAATPRFSPGAGTYSSAQTVTIHTATPGAAIYYTTNGSTPTTGSAVYSGPITVSATETLEAVAAATGYSTSAAGSAAYTFGLPAATPTFGPGAGTYSSTQTVTIGTTTHSATIYYTTNGSTPTTSSTVYSGPITVSSTETVEAITVAPDYSTSAVGSATYTMNLPTPSFTVVVSPASLAVTAGQSGTTTVLVTPQNAFGGAVSFRCSGLPSGASCSFSPATVTTSGAVASTTLTVTTATTTAALRRNSSPLFPGSALAVALCCFGWKKRRGLQMLPLALVAIGLSLCTGCSLGVWSPSQANTQATATTVTVIATAGSLQPATSFTLTVQ